MQTTEPAMGWICSYTPRELILAAGFTPVKLLPGAEQETSWADSFLPSNFCPYVRRLCDLCLQDPANLPEDLLLVLSCDPMRRLADILSGYGHFRNLLRLDVPRRRDRLAQEFLTAQLQDVQQHLEAVAGRRISDNDLDRAIQGMNRSRTLLQELARVRSSCPESLPGSRYHQLTVAWQTQPPDRVNGQLRSILKDIQSQSRTGGGQSGPRLLLTGSVVEDSGLLAHIQELGGHVVCEDTCSGERDVQSLVDTTGPGLQSLAYRLLQRPPCARMLGAQERVQRVLDLARTHACAGVMVHTLKFCDLTQADLPGMQAALTEAGIPMLHLEQDSPSENKGQLSTRIQAFLESLA